MDHFDLTKGKIVNKLFLVALPVMGTSMIQMAYNLTDMVWLGHLGSAAVAASGTAGMYNWLAQSLMLFCKTGAEIGISQNFGRNERDKAYAIASMALLFSVVFALFITALYIIFARPLIAFFQIQDSSVVENAIDYLIIISLGIIFQFLIITITGMFNGSGNSKTPFFFGMSGLILNMVLDPILIYVFDFGVIGAAYATLFSQFIVCIGLIIYLKFFKGNLHDFHLKLVWKKAYLKLLFHWGIPIALESGFFTIISMILARYVSYYGSTAIAVQKIGSQIESISWMVAQGFGAAMSAFIGQNYGAHAFDRIKIGYHKGILIMFIWGLFTSFGLFLFSNSIFHLFMTESDAILQGANYLVILSYSQLFMCLELTAAGAFRGMGKTVLPSAVSIGLNLLRIPLALLFSQTYFMGINGIWWALTVTSILKGIITPLSYQFVLKKSVPK